VNDTETASNSSWPIPDRLVKAIPGEAFDWTGMFRSCVLVLCLVSIVLCQEVRVILSNASVPGPDAVTLIPNGDFENGTSNWSHANGQMSAGAVPEEFWVPSGVASAVARASIADDSSAGMYTQTVSLEGNTAYVLSAYVWVLTDNNHRIDVAVVDLSDAGLGSKYGIWEGQLTLYPNTPNADVGYFIYSPFRTAPDTTLVTIRVFYVGFSETDNNWPYYPTAVMWDNIAITRVEDFPYSVTAPPMWPEEDPVVPAPLVTNNPDTNGDNRVDFLDVEVIAANWLSMFAYADTGQTITIEAENYASNSPSRDHSWIQRRNSNAGGGNYMQALPDKGSIVNADIETTSAHLSYLVDFQMPGKYYLWVRGKAEDASSDSLHYGLDRLAASSGSTHLELPSGVFDWNTLSGPVRPALHISRIGIHNVDLWMREDGAMIDKLVLTSDSGFNLADVPGTGSVESPRTEIEEPKADINQDGLVDGTDFSKMAGNWKSRRADPNTLMGKIMCGYQGWFNCPGDGAYPDRGWNHYEKAGKFEPGYCSIDFWPDVSELDEDEIFPTAFELPDGNTAHVFSSHSRKTLNRHFRWMRDYGIDGVFMQRFAGSVAGKSGLSHNDFVLDGARTSANEYGRVYAVMYDLSGLGEGGTGIVIEDWKHLVDDLALTVNPDDRAYLHHNGKPVVAVWGIGFNDGRQYTLDECKSLVQFFKNDPTYGGLTVMVGVPSYWRTLSRDCLNDPKVHEVILEADIVSPWAVGRYGSSSGVDNYTSNVWKPDMQWCADHGMDYLPVVFPGFSWGNLQGHGFNSIPRSGGSFLWRQFYRAINDAGVQMIYQAMFDEVDEGTAIFKCTSTPAQTPTPSPGSTFLDYEGLPTDHYLWLVGQGARMLRREIPASIDMPSR